MLLRFTILSNPDEPSSINDLPNDRKNLLYISRAFAQATLCERPNLRKYLQVILGNWGSCQVAERFAQLLINQYVQSRIVELGKIDSGFQQVFDVSLISIERIKVVLKRLL